MSQRETGWAETLMASVMIAATGASLAAKGVSIFIIGNSLLATKH